MPEARPTTAERLCTSAELVERGHGVVFDLLLYGRPARGFALRIDGTAVAYLNQCAHVPTELDWVEGVFLDLDQRYIVCAVHGATYEPDTGHCIAGPCTGAHLRRIVVSEADGLVHWHPTSDIRPLPARAVAATASPP